MPAISARRSANYACCGRRSPSTTCPDPWWPQQEESEASLRRRSQTFCTQIAEGPWPETAVVTHWGFIRALTGLAVPNGAVLRIDPVRPEDAAEPVFLPQPAPDRGER